MVSESGDRQKMAHSAHSMLNDLAGVLWQGALWLGRFWLGEVRHGRQVEVRCGASRWGTVSCG